MIVTWGQHLAYSMIGPLDGVVFTRRIRKGQIGRARYMESPRKSRTCGRPPPRPDPRGCEINVVITFALLHEGPPPIYEISGAASWEIEDDPELINDVTFLYTDGGGRHKTSVWPPESGYDELVYNDSLPGWARCICAVSYKKGTSPTVEVFTNSDIPGTWSAKYPA